MLIGQRLRELREAKNLSQGDIEKRTGLVRPYTSRVENGHTVPSIETLEKYARALEVPLYRLFYESDEPPTKLKLRAERAKQWGAAAEEWFRTLAKLLRRMSEKDRKLLLTMAQQMARRNPIK
jgi:transcriptional regulator with XRE-family HTH domain